MYAYTNDRCLRMNADNNKERLAPHYATWGRRDQLIVGTFLQSVFWFLLFALYSYAMVMPTELTFQAKLSLCDGADNWMGSIGCHLAHYLVYELAGMVAFLLPLLPYWLSIALFLRKSSLTIFKGVAIISFLILWSATAISYFHYANQNKVSQWYLYPGQYGMEMMRMLGNLLGGGVVLLLVASLVSVIILLNFKYLPALRSFRIGAKKKKQASPPTKTEDTKEGTSKDAIPFKASPSSTKNAPLWHKNPLAEEKKE